MILRFGERDRLLRVRGGLLELPLLRHAERQPAREKTDGKPASPNVSWRRSPSSSVTLRSSTSVAFEYSPSEW